MANTRTRTGVTFVVLATAALAFSLLQSLIIPAIPQLEHTLHTSEDSASWLLTAYLLSAAIATPILGRIGDATGKEKMMVIVLVALSVGTLVSALATSLTVMLVGRVIQGAAGAVFPLSFGIIRDEFPAERVAGAIGVLSAILGLGVGAGILLAGPILEHLSYHWLFWLPLVMALGATIATFVFVPESTVRAGGGINWLGALLMSGWLVTGLLAVSYGPTWGWHSCDRARALRRHRSPDRALDLVGVPLPHAPCRHAHDAHPGCVEHEPGCVAVRLRHVRHVHHRAPVRADADVSRLRVRGLGHPIGPVSPSLRVGDGPGRTPDRPALEAGGFQDRC